MIHWGQQVTKRSRWVLSLTACVVFLLPKISIVKADEFKLSGSLSQRYQYRTTGALHDSDIETLVSLDFGDSLNDRFSGALQAGGIFDLDGKSGDSSLSSVYDTFRGPAVGRLYYAYFDAKDLGPISELRVGRQHLYEFESLYFDGAHITFPAYKKIIVSTFGGTPVHPFENQIGFDPGDYLVGTDITYQPLTNLKFRLDYVHLKDQLASFRGTIGDQSDDLLGFTTWWDINDYLSLTTRLTSFIDQLRDVSSDLVFRWTKKDLFVRFNFTRLLRGYDIRVIDLDAYGIAGTYRPYTELSLNVNKGWGDHFATDGGFAIRFLDRNQIASAFNHGFERFYLGLSVYDLPIKDLSISLTGDYYHSEDNTLRDHTFGGSLQVSQDLLDKRLGFSGGTAFYLYRYNLYSGNESSNVRTYFAAAKGKIRKDLEAKVSYEFEDNDFNNFHRTDFRLIWSF